MHEIFTQPIQKFSFLNPRYAYFSPQVDMRKVEEIHDQYLGGNSHCVFQGSKGTAVSIIAQTWGAINTDQVDYPLCWPCRRNGAYLNIPNPNFG